jgi:hypothetical protein
MPNFVSNTITINGEIQIAAAIAKQQLVITRVQVGAGVATGALPSLTALVAPVMYCTPIPPQVSANLLQPGEVVVMSVLDTANVTTIFQLTELGVFATSAGGPEQLIAYCACSAPYDTIAPGSGSNRLILNLQVPIVVGIGASVSITVQAGNPVYVPPVVAGPGIVVTAPTDTSGRIIEWIVSTPRITQNTTLYVSNSYTQNIAPYFSSLANAMYYLSSFTISSGISVYIDLAAETFTLATTTVIYHVNASQITIQGANNPDVTFNGIGTITGATGNWKVQLLNVSSTANIKVGTWLNIWLVNWTWMGPLVSGCCQVTAVAGSTVTVQNYYYGSTWPNMAGVNGQMTPLSTVLDFTYTQGGAGLWFTNGIGLMQYVAVINPPGQANNYVGYGVLMSGGISSTIRFVGVWGFRGNTGQSVGFAASGCLGICQCCSASYNDNGFTAGGSGANLDFQGCCSTHNNIGAWANGDCAVSFVVGIYNTPNFVAGSRAQGVFASGNSSINVFYTYKNGQLVNQAVMSCYNKLHGFQLYSKCSTGFGTSTSVFWAAYNGGYDVCLNIMSSLAGQSYIQGTRNFNIPPNVLSADGCLLI